MSADAKPTTRPPRAVLPGSRSTPPRAAAALNAITAGCGDNRTDAINNSLRVSATLLALAHHDGTLHVLAPDGTTHVVHLP